MSLKAKRMKITMGKLKIEFDYFMDYHRAATWHKGEHVVALSHSWESAERLLMARLGFPLRDTERPKPPAKKEIEI